MTNPPDIVFPVRKGERNEELRYALRSLSNVSHRQVWLTGHAPGWVREVGYIQRAQKGTKHQNSLGNLLKACRDACVSEEFLRWDDDTFLLRPIASVPILHRGTIADTLAENAVNAHSRYYRGLAVTLEILKKLGIKDPLCYELHVPLLMTKRGVLMAHAEATADGMPETPALQIRSLYANLEKIGGEYAEDVKVFVLGDKWEPGPIPFVSTIDSLWGRHQASLLVKRTYKEPGCYERHPRRVNVASRIEKPAQPGERTESMHDVVLLVPRRSDGGVRDKLWEFSRAWWAEQLSGWRVVEGHHEGGPFNRSAAVNAAAERAGSWEVAVIMDADVLPDSNAMRAAVATARSGVPAVAYDHRKHLTSRGTEMILAGHRGSWEGLVKHDLVDAVSGAYAVSRSLWDEVGGFDELFVGWGWEDIAFRIATETLGGPMARVAGTLWHLWHPNSPENNTATATFQANRERGNRYKAARWDKVTINVLLDERGRPRSLPATQPGEDSRIPRILHRTVPAESSPESDRFWARAAELHPGWEMMEHRDPLDPAEWPETSALWPRCTSGAQMAGLIRLEALNRWGGIYLDSDVEPYRSLEPLLASGGFAAWEDRNVVPDAVLGFRRGHPALATMLVLACGRVQEGKGAWDSGPGVTTLTLPGRADVLLLPPGSFYPYHYSVKERDRGRNHVAEQPWAFGAHHWAHSWKGH